MTGNFMHQEHLAYILVKLNTVLIMITKHSTTMQIVSWLSYDIITNYTNVNIGIALAGKIYRESALVFKDAGIAAVKFFYLEHIWLLIEKKTAI